MPIQNSKITQEAELRGVISNLYRAAENQQGMSRDKLAKKLGLSTKTIQRTASGHRDISLGEFLVFQEKFPSISKPMNILLGETPVDKNTQSNEITAPRLNLTYSRWVRSHLKLRWRIGARAIKPDKWREARDWTLLVAISYSFIKVLNVWAGFRFGLSNDYNDPTLLVSICITLMFGYAMFEDLLRKRYFIGAAED